MLSENRTLSFKISDSLETVPYQTNTQYSLTRLGFDLSRKNNTLDLREGVKPPSQTGLKR